jgi:hypothetical protein
VNSSLSGNRALPCLLVRPRSSTGSRYAITRWRNGVVREIKAFHCLLVKPRSQVDQLARNIQVGVEFDWPKTPGESVRKTIREFLHTSLLHSLHIEKGIITGRLLILRATRIMAVYEGRKCNVGDTCREFNETSKHVPWYWSDCEAQNLKRWKLSISSSNNPCVPKQ